MMKLLFLNMGEGEVALIVLFIILFFGSKSIPTLARGLGKGIREFKDATQGIQREIENSANSVKEELEVKKEEEKK
jgi:sec-independent protein translocase protein TatA